MIGPAKQRISLRPEHDSAFPDAFPVPLQIRQSRGKLLRRSLSSGLGGMRRVDLDVFSPEARAQSAVLLLNSEAGHAAQAEHVEAWWPLARFRAAADGAGNGLRAQPRLPLPHLLSGDFDSITEDNLAFYRSKEEVEVVETPDQDHTDFTKALWLVKDKLNKGQLDKSKVHRMVVLGGLGGRFDQVLSCLNVHYCESPTFPVPLLLLDGSSLLCLLRQSLPSSLSSSPTSPWESPSEEGESEVTAGAAVEGTCGLAPFAGRAVVTTSGLKWDVAGAEFAFGGLVSTSNVVLGRTFTVKTDKPLVLTLNLHKELYAK